MYDAIVIGARCAGAAAAMLLARKGHRVLLLDRTTFPADIPHGHFIHRQGPEYLQRWGLLDRIIASGCPPVDYVLTDFGDFPLAFEDLEVGGVAFGIGPRRRTLDQILVDAAVEAGAEFRPGSTVEGCLSEDDVIQGVRARNIRTGQAFEERARLTIGADGRNSRLARTVQAPVYEAAPALACYYFSYWSGVPHRGLELYFRESRGIFAHPTNDGLFAVFAGWPIAEFPRIKTDIERHFHAALDLVPELAGRVREGRREEPFYGTADLPNFFRKPYGPGWALVGDAGNHKDPIMALGVRDALAHAELLADAAHAGLSGRADLSGALRDYEQRRNESSRPLYRRNLERATLAQVPAEMLQLRAALRGRKQDATRFWLADQGMIPAREFFNPENMGRILGQAANGD